jgi:hypothetical protein
MTFPELIKEWETFYLMVGTAAATLIGLLFVAVSIHAKRPQTCTTLPRSHSIVSFMFC